MTLTPEQSQILKNALLMGAFAYGSKKASSLARYALFGYVGYQLFKMWKGNGGSLTGTQADGWNVQVDSDLAVDMLFPMMQDDHKAYIKTVGREVVGAIKARGSQVFGSNVKG